MNILLVHLREGGREGKEGERAGGKDEGRQREGGRERGERWGTNF